LNTGENGGNGARPCVINFHGGGFSIGSSTDDSRFAYWCIRTTTTTSSNPNPTSKGLGATFISVEYRLSPEYPHPTPVYDCIDSTLYILSHADEFGIDSDKIFLSGFSAGGSLAVTTALALSPSSSSSSSAPSGTGTNSTQRTKRKHSIAGVIPFYPVLDFNTPRSQKLANSPKAKPLPGWMTRMFDTSYLPPSTSLDRKSSMISPGLCPDELLKCFPNTHLCLCGGDVLAHEGRMFGERLQRLGERVREPKEGGKQGGREYGNEVIIREVPGVRHGWDKPPLPLQASVGEEYDAAIESMKRWCEE
jgi:acetyl esterase/lipase